MFYDKSERPLCGAEIDSLSARVKLERRFPSG
jgi:hypothetical protein